MSPTINNEMYLDRDKSIGNSDGSDSRGRVHVKIANSTSEPIPTLPQTTSGVPQRFTVEGSTTPGTEQTLISETVPTGKTWTVLLASVLSRMTGRWTLTVDGNFEGSGFTGPGGNNQPFKFENGVLTANAGEVVEIKFTARAGSKTGSCVDGFLHVTEE